jgi:hypothetical protein
MLAVYHSIYTICIKCGLLVTKICRCFLRVNKIPHLRWLFLLNVLIKGGMQPFGGYKIKFLENTTLKGGFHQFYHQKN